MNFKKKMFKKLACLAMSTTLMFGALPQITYAKDYIVNPNIEVINNLVKQNNLILNGDFSEGLNHWVGEAEIINIDGINYAVLGNGVPISQAVRVQPWHNYAITFSSLAGTTGVNGSMTVLGLLGDSTGSFEVLAYEEISSERNLELEDYILEFSTSNISAILVIVFPYMDSNYVVTNFRFIEVS